MKKDRYSKAHIIAILKEAEEGISVAEVCRKHGISDVTYENWKANWGGMTVSGVKRLRVWRMRTGGLSNL